MKYLYLLFCLFLHVFLFAQSNFLTYEGFILNKLNYIILDKNNTASENTERIQELLNKRDTLILPNYAVEISDIGLSLRSNQILVFQDRSQLKLQASEKTNYELLRVHNVSNVRIYNPQIIGDRNSHLDNKGQWGFGISIRNSQNVIVEGGYISSMWGDGVYIGQINGFFSSNVSIDNVYIDDCRRNGISITSGKGVVVKNCLIENTKGQSPQSGIDIEPNTINDEIVNISLVNNVTRNNLFAGVLIVLEKFKEEKVKKVSISIDNHSNNGSYYSLAVHGFLNSKEKNMKGFIKVRNFESKNIRQEQFIYKNTSLSRVKLDWK